MSSPTINLLVVDDHHVIIQGLQLFIEDAQDVVIVDIAANGREALKILEKNNTGIDIVITDVNMPEVSGIELLQKIREHYPHLKVLVLSAYKEKNILHNIIKLEADGYLLKSMSQKMFLEAVRHVYNGGVFYDKEITALVKEINSSLANNSENVALTERELDVLKLICKEFSNIEIAAQLAISVNTVETHRKHIFKKLEAKNIVALIKHAIKLGF